MDEVSFYENFSVPNPHLRSALLREIADGKGSENSEKRKDDLFFRHSSGHSNGRTLPEAASRYIFSIHDLTSRVCPASICSSTFYELISSKQTKNYEPKI